MKLIIEVTDDYYDECNRWVRQNVANLDQYVIANGVEYVEPKKGKWNVISLLRDYVYVRCSECGQGTRLVRDSKNEFCCIKDIRDKIVACPYCGADMREADNE